MLKLHKITLDYSLMDNCIYKIINHYFKLFIYYEALGHTSQHFQIGAIVGSQLISPLKGLQFLFVLHYFSFFVWSDSPRIEIPCCILQCLDERSGDEEEKPGKEELLKILPVQKAHSRSFWKKKKKELWRSLKSARWETSRPLMLIGSPSSLPTQPRQVILN